MIEVVGLDLRGSVVAVGDEVAETGPGGFIVGAYQVMVRKASKFGSGEHRLPGVVVGSAPTRSLVRAMSTCQFPPLPCTVLRNACSHFIFEIFSQVHPV